MARIADEYRGSVKDGFSAQRRRRHNLDGIGRDGQRLRWNASTTEVGIRPRADTS
jgi:hypothetical protein